MTILRPEQAATSHYAAAHAQGTLPSRDERMAQAATAFRRGETTRCLLILREHLVQQPDDLPALALLLEAGGVLLPNEKPKWASHATYAAAEIRRCGDLSEHAAARTGLLLLRRTEIAAASAVCDWIERRYPDGPDAALFLAEFYGRIGEPAMALARLQAAAKAAPDNVELHLRVVERLIAWGRAREALATIQAAVERETSGRSLSLLARCLVAAGSPEAAPALVDQALAAGAAAPSLLPVAQDLLQAGAGALARAVVDALVVHAPDNAELVRLQAELRLASGDAVGAVAGLERAMTLSPTVATAEVLAEALLGLDRSDEAAGVAARMAAVAPQSLSPDIIRSKVLRADGEIAAADALDEVLMARVALEATVPGRRQRVRMAGLIGPGGLGDFVYQLLALCSLRQQFVDAGLTLFYNNDFSYKRDVLRFCPDVEELRDLGDSGLAIPVNTKQLHDFRQHLFFSQVALSPTLLTRLDRTATLVTPPEDVDELTARLIGHGVDPDRWFVVMHYRDSGSFAGASAIAPGGFNPATTRDVDPATFHRLAASICEAGGQVVRLGHPGMAAIPKAPGYIDLIDGGLPLQLFATSKARFMIACDSGPTSYATAFKTPLLKTNAICEDGAAYATDLILNKNLINWRGEVLAPESMLKGRKALYKRLVQSAHGFRLADNSFEQLRTAVDMMMERTEAQVAAGGWREAATPTTPAPDVIAWPTHTETRALTLDLSHLSGRVVRAVSAEALEALLPPTPGV
ncbi:MAG: TIGR04372 family glycosyltransferase [Caulobacterales bacterium]|nr:TIGR04372 family glycosyltransferase [Caulobacterales bacterium]